MIPMHIAITLAASMLSLAWQMSHGDMVKAGVAFGWLTGLICGLWLARA